MLSSLLWHDAICEGDPGPIRVWVPRREAIHSSTAPCGSGSQRFSPRASHPTAGRPVPKHSRSAPSRCVCHHPEPSANGIEFLGWNIQPLDRWLHRSPSLSRSRKRRWSGGAKTSLMGRFTRWVCSSLSRPLVRPTNTQFAARQQVPRNRSVSTKVSAR
jgi:hypothetical protein